MQAIDQRKISMTIVMALAVFSLFLAYSYPFHLIPWPTFFNEWFFALFIALGLSITISSGQLKRASPWSWILGLAFIAAHYLLLQNMQPLLWERFWVTISFIALGYAAFLLGRNLDTSALMTRPLAVIWAAAVLAAGVAILQYLGTFATQQWNLGLVLFLQGGRRAASLIGQSNQLGTLLVIGCWVVGFAWTRLPRTAAWRAVALGSLALFACGIYLSGSRTAFLNLLLGPVLLLAWNLRQKNRSYRLVLLAAVPLVCVLALGLIGQLELQGPATGAALGNAIPAAQPFANRIGADSTRLAVWQMAWTAVQESPWIGHGLGGMVQSHLQLAPQFGPFNDQIMKNAHNAILELWVNYGLVFGSIVAGAFIWTWWRAWKAATTPDRQFIWLMCTAMLVHAMLEYPLHYGFFFWLLCMLLGHLTAKPDEAAHTIKRAGLASTLWTVGSLAILFVAWKGYVDTESHYTDLRTQGYTQVREGVDRADPLAQWLYPGLLKRLYWQTRPIRDAADWPAQDVDEFAQVASLDPTPLLITKMAWVQGMRGNVEQATWWTERVCRMYSQLTCTQFRDTWTTFGATHPEWPTLPWPNWQNN